MASAEFPISTPRMDTIPHLEIAGRLVGPGQPTYIIAEISANHGQDYEQAARLVRLARECGVDAVKLQTYTPDTLTIDSDKEWFRIGKGTLWEGRNLYELYQEAYTPWEWQPKLKALADEIGITLFSTPFDETAVDFLESMQVPAHKIASFELVDLPLIRRVAATRKPVIMSTGMATLGEIDDAVAAFREAGGTQLALLKCTSAYPSPPEEMNLRTIQHLSSAFGVPAGLSDHTMGYAIPVAAVSVGACIVEKHFTETRSIPGPDSAFSLEPQELKEMVQAIRMAERALGSVNYAVTPKEAASRAFRRSLFVVADVRAGEIFTARNLRSIRPGYGLPVKTLSQFLGRRAAKDISRGTPATWDLIA